MGGQSKKENKKDSLVQLQSHQSGNLSGPVMLSPDTAFLSYWSGFAYSVRNSDLRKFRKLALNEIENNGKLLSLNDFIGSCFKKVFDTALVSCLRDSSKVKLSDFEIEDDSLKKYDRVEGRIYSNIIKQAVITKSDVHPDNPIVIVLEFLSTDRGYKFCGWKGFGTE